MVDKKQNDEEYQIPDMENYPTESYSDEAVYTNPDMVEPPPQRNNNTILRKALAVVALVVLIMIAYKFLGSRFKDTTNPTSMPSLGAPSEPATPAPPLPQFTDNTPTPAAPMPAPVPQINADAETQKKMAALELTQQNLRSQMEQLQNQVNNTNSNISTVNTKIAALSQTLDAIMSQLDKQSDFIQRMQARLVVKPKPKPVITKPVVQIQWNVQAAIPGRAWLIASNGSTLTVRQGSMVPGYGIVKMIDAEQGKVYLNTGRMIGFSSQDS